ncbi:MAG: NADPH-dependent F420 reductase [Candidatus Promineifilaceae bacterium]
MKIAILGGTGDEGFGLGFRWAAAGHEIIIGSRNAEKGFNAAADLQEKLPDAVISGTDNLTAASLAEIVVLSVPYAAQTPTLSTVKDALQGKLLITVVAPTGDKKARAWRLPSGLSAAEEAQEQLGEGVQIVAAFQNIGAHLLLDLDFDLDCDVLVCGNKADDKQIVLQLCRDAGLRGVNCGALQNARVVEELTSVLIAINVIHRIKNAGIRITGLPGD